MATGSVITLQHKRGITANMPSLAVGEIYFATDSNIFWVGSSLGINIKVVPDIPVSLDPPTLPIPTL